MKKLTLLSLVVVTGLVFGSSVFAADPVVSSSTAEVKVEKSPWSALGIMELGRTVLDKNPDAFSNATTLLVARKVSENVKLKLYLPVSNVFRAKADETRLDQYFSLVDPVVAVSHGKLFELAGWSASGGLRAYLPLTEDSRQEGSDRNPHYGKLRYNVSLSKDVGPFSFGLYQQARYFMHRFSEVPGTDGAKVNGRYMMINEASASLTVNETLTTALTLDFINNWNRSAYADKASQTMEVTATADVTTGLSNVTSALHFSVATPKQNVSRLFVEDSDYSVLENTSMLLEMTYSFI